MKTDKLRKQFEKETGKGTEIPDFLGEPVTFTSAYVEWLENFTNALIDEQKDNQQELSKQELIEELIKVARTFESNYAWILDEILQEYRHLSKPEPDKKMVFTKKDLSQIFFAGYFHNEIKKDGDFDSKFEEVYQRHLKSKN